MQQADEIVFISLHNAGVHINDKIKTMKDIIAETGLLYNIITQLLKVIDQQQYGIFTDNLPKQTSDKVRVCAQQSAILKKLGYQENMSYHQILYPKSSDATQILSFLLKNLPIRDSRTNTRNTISKVLYSYVHNASRRSLPPKPTTQKNVNDALRIQNVLDSVNKQKLNGYTDILDDMRNASKAYIVKEEKDIEIIKDNKTPDVLVSVELRENTNEKKKRLEEALNQIEIEQKELKTSLTTIKTRIKTVDDFIIQEKNVLRQMLETKDILEKQKKLSDRQDVIKKKLNGLDASDKQEYLKALKQLKLDEKNKLVQFKQEWIEYENSLKLDLNSAKIEYDSAILKAKEMTRSVRDLRHKGKLLIVDIQELDDLINKQTLYYDGLDKRNQRQSHLDVVNGMTSFLKKQDNELQKIIHDSDLIKSELSTLQTNALEQGNTLIASIQQNHLNLKSDLQLSLNKQVTHMTSLFASLNEIKRKKGDATCSILLLKEKIDKTTSRVNELGHNALKKDYDEMHALNLELLKKIKDMDNAINH
ncbi:CCDC22 N-terminal domain-containing protein [Entamoeba marina]